MTGLAIAEMVHASAPTDEAIQAFLDHHEFPLAEGGKVTFVFRGEADEVRLRHWVYGLSSSETLHRIRGTDLWYHVLELPEKSRVEYKLEVTRGGDVQWIQDPLNPHLARDPFGANSVAHGWGYETPEWTRTDPSARQGNAGGSGLPERGTGRAAPHHHLPAGAFSHHPAVPPPSGPRRGGLHGVCRPEDGAGQPHPPAGDPGGGGWRSCTHRDRMEQYRASEAHARYLAEELVPQLESELPLMGTPEGRCLMGASLGAVASLSTAVQLSRDVRAAAAPVRVLRVLRHREARTGTRLRSHRGIRERLSARIPRRSAEKVFVSCGTYESLIYENRSLVPLLQSHGNGRALRRGSGRTQLGELARPAARGALVALPRTALAGLRLTKEFCAWPT